MNVFEDNFTIDSPVVLQMTADEYLDGATGKVVGFYMDDLVVVLFDEIPQGYFPAIVISRYCLAPPN